MPKRLTTLNFIAVIALASILLLLWWALHSNSKPPRVSMRPGPAEIKQPAHVVDLRGSEEEQAAPSLRRSESDRRVADHLNQNFDLSDTIWVDGRIVYPFGTPQDEQIELYAQVRPTVGSRINSNNHFEGRMKGDIPFARCTVNPDGSFRAPFRKDTRQGFLVLRARYLHMKAVRVLFPSNSVVLEPKLGAWLTGRVILPPDQPGGVASISLLKPTVYLWRSEESGTPYWSIPDRDQSFYIGGIPPASKGECDLVLDLPGFAFARDSDLEFTPGGHVHRDIKLMVGGRIEGHALDGADAPVPGVEIKYERVLFRSQNEIRQATSGPDGSFVLRGLPPGKLRLTAECAGWKPEPIPLLEINDGESVENLIVRLTKGTTITGKILWPGGEPASGATVTLSYRQKWFSGTEESSVRTDSKGEFVLSGLGEGSFNIQAEATRTYGDTNLPWSAHQKEVPSSNGIVLILRPPVAVHGMVVDDLGHYIEHFTIFCRRPDGASGSLSRSFETDDGAFEFSDLPRGEWELYAAATDHANSDKRLVRLDDPIEPLTFMLPRLAIVSGVVLDPTGIPVPGARVDTLGRAAASPTTTSDPCDSDGRFLQRVPPRHLLLVAKADGWSPSLEQMIVIMPGMSLEGVELHLRHGGRLTGEVYRGNAPDAGRPVVVTAASASAEHATTDEKGHFEFDQLPPGRYLVLAVPDSLLTMPDGELDLAEVLNSGHTKPVDIVEGETTHVVLGARVRKPIRLYGRVTVDGAPATGMLVTFCPEGDHPEWSLKIGTVTASGEYEVTVDEPGPYLVLVGRDLAGSPQAEFFVQVPSEPNYELDLAIPLGGISGRVFDPDGVPVEGVPVSVRLDGHGGLLGLGIGRVTNTDPNGDYSFEGLPPGVYSIRAGSSLLPSEKHSGGLAVITGVSVEGEDVVGGVDVHLTRSGTIRGTVTDMSGSPVSGASIFFRQNGGSILNPASNCLSGHMGRFECRSLPPGMTTVIARYGDMCSLESRPVRVEQGDSVEIDLVVDHGAWMAIAVKHGDRDMQAVIRVRDSAGRECGGMASMTESGQVLQGGFSSTLRQFGPLAPGRYEIEAITEDGSSASQTVDLSSQENRFLAIRL